MTMYSTDNGDVMLTTLDEARPTFTPERRLLLALLEDGIRRARLGQEQERKWVESTSSAQPFSFARLCDAFGFAPEPIRREVLRVATSQPKPVRTRQPYTPDELATIQQLHREGQPDSAIAAQLHRTVGSIAKARRLVRVERPPSILGRALRLLATTQRPLHYRALASELALPPEQAESLSSSLYTAARRGRCVVVAAQTFAVRAENAARSRTSAGQA